VRRGLSCHALRFESAHQPLCPVFDRRHREEYVANQTVHVRWVRHPTGDARATLIFLHSWMQPWTPFEDRLLLEHLARKLRVDVARMALPYHGHRKPQDSLYDGEYFWTADLVRTFEAIRQSVIDVRTLLGWLEAQTQREVGVCGISLGGMITLATACVEPRASFVVPVAAHLDLAAIMEEASLLKRMRTDLRARGWSGADVESYVQRVGLNDWTPVLPRERIFFVAGRYDRFLRPDRVIEIWRRWGEPAIDWYPGGHLGMFRYLRGTSRASPRSSRAWASGPRRSGRRPAELSRARRAASRDDPSGSRPGSSAARGSRPRSRSRRCGARRDRRAGSARPSGTS